MIPLGITFIKNYNPPRDGTLPDAIVAGTTVMSGAITDFTS